MILSEENSRPEIESPDSASNVLLSRAETIAVSEEKLFPLPESLCYRIAERIVAAVGLLALSPLMLLVAAVLCIQQRGSVLYRQTRVGRGEKLFTIYKFRTMRLDAEKDGPFICTNYSDARITTLGQKLRRSKLDELPQLWNIVRGEMSFVGPRPERPHFHAQFSAIPHWRQRTRVYPGLTGLAQASKWISHDPVEKLQADLVYLRERKASLDLRLIFFTLFPKLRPKTLHGVKLN